MHTLFLHRLVFAVDGGDSDGVAGLSCYLLEELSPRVATWLILPVVICLSQRLSHACLSITACTAKLRMAH
jgi:hypothetical protein